MEQTASPTFQVPDLSLEKSNWSKVHRCYVCHKIVVFYSCQNCGKNFHRRCALMGSKFPKPTFDQDVETAMEADFGEVNLLKCSECNLSENTWVERLVGVSHEDLTFCFKMITGSIYGLFQKDQDFNFMRTVPRTNLEIIKTRAEQGYYKTLEALFADFKSMLVEVAQMYGELSEEFASTNQMIGKTKDEIVGVMSCVPCYLKRFDERRERVSVKEIAQRMQQPCNVPHVVAWAKLPRFRYWPCKILNINIFKGKVMVMFFGDGTTNYISPEEDRILISENEPSVGMNGGCGGDGLSRAIVYYQNYLINAKKKFGPYCLPTTPQPFGGGLKEWSRAQRKMFPNFEM